LTQSKQQLEQLIANIRNGRLNLTRSFRLHAVTSTDDLCPSGESRLGRH
jgi:hypothetical protein